MVYPAKTSAKQITRAALRRLERKGPLGLSMRTLAADIGVVPTALYGYFPDRDALLAAVADAGTRLLFRTIQRAALHKSGMSALKAVAEAYLVFAEKRPTLYMLLMSPHTYPEGYEPAHNALWEFVVAHAAAALGRAKAVTTAVSLWAYLHGVIGLQEANVFSMNSKPRNATREGLKALLNGFSLAGLRKD